MFACRLSQDGPGEPRDIHQHGRHIQKQIELEDETLSLATTLASTQSGSLLTCVREQKRRGHRAGKRSRPPPLHHKYDEVDPPAPSSSGGSSSTLYSLEHSQLVSITHRPAKSLRPSRRSKRSKRSKILEEPLNLYGREQQRETWANSILTDQDRPQLVLVSGASGSGKSRLVHQLTTQFDGHLGLTTTSTTQDNNLDQNHSLWTLGGKFHSKHNLPYSAFSLIFEDLCYSLLNEQPQQQQQQEHSSDTEATQQKRSFFYAEICTKLRAALNDDESRLLIQFVPSLQNMLLVQTLDFQSELEEQEATRNKLGDTDQFSKTQYEFQTIFQKVIRVLCKCVAKINSRLVLMLDDLQWADQASVQLIREILLMNSNSDRSSHGNSHSGSQDRDSRKERVSCPGGLIVVGCYRDDQVDEDHPLMALLDELEGFDKDCAINIHRLEIENLSLQDVQLMITDIMMLSSNLSEDEGRKSTTPVLEQLAERVHEKTSGNPFFVIQYLRSLLEVDGTTSLRGAEGEWDWEAILKRGVPYGKPADGTSIAPLEVMDVLRGRLCKLPIAVTRLLPMIGSLGFTFQRSVFIDVVNHCSNRLKKEPESSPKSIARVCIEQGLIEKNGTEWYRWTNNSLEEAALSLIEDHAELASLQFGLAQVLFEKLGSVEMEQSLFVIANMFLSGGVQNHAPSLDCTRRVELARLYLRAGTKAIEAGMFDTAVCYLHAGVYLLPDDNRWTSHYELSLDLYSSLAQAEYCTGDFDAMKTHCDEVIGQNNRPLLDKQRVYHALLDSIATRDTAENATRLCLELLSKLGCKIPKSGHCLRVASGLMRVKMSMGKFKKEDPLKHAVMKDPAKLWAMKLMDKLLKFLYVERSPMVPLPILKSVRWTMKYGTCDWSMPALASVGFMLSSFMGDFSGGEAYAKRAVALLEKSGSEVALPKTYLVSFGLVLPWTTPYSACRKDLMKGYAIGLENGDVATALLCYLFSIWLSFLSGDDLENMRIDMESFVIRSQRVKDSNTEQSALISLEAIRHLSSVDIGERDLLLCESIDESELTRLNLYPTLNFFQLNVNFYFGDHQSVVEFIEKNGDKYFEKMLPGVPMVATATFMSALSHLTLAKETGQSKYEKMAKGFTKRIKTWVDKGNPNIVQYRALLDAEWAGLKGKPEEAIHTYNVAILMAERRGLVQDLALAHELFSGFYSRVGRREEAREHLTKARNLYEEWGAQAVARRLVEDHPEHFNTPSIVQAH